MKKKLHLKKLLFKPMKGIISILALIGVSDMLGSNNSDSEETSITTNIYASSNKNFVDEGINSEFQFGDLDGVGISNGARLDVELICQLPELYNGCEITSLTMLLNYKGVDMSKMELASNMSKDATPLIRDNYGNIISWGNPDVGFVGDVTGNDVGYAINPGPLVPLVNKFYEGGAVNLTGSGVNDLMEALDKGNPVMVWISGSFVLPVQYECWTDSQGQEVKGTFNSHTVLLTGYDDNNFYYNDPLTGYKDASVSIDTFETVWKEMGRKALSVN